MQPNNTPPIYALDFDGVICDSAIETAITGWKAAQQIWQGMQHNKPSSTLIDDFRRVRPFLETGYEAILIIRLLQQGVSVKTLNKNYHAILQTLIEENQLKTTQLKQLFGTSRDQWITQSMQEWLTMNPFFAGVVEKLAILANNTDNPWYIITTKQKRFVQHILQHHNIPINEQSIYAMEAKMSKQDTLLQLRDKHPDQTIIFIEDRLPTLLNINKNKQLKSIILQLVDWGYTTDEDKQTTQRYPIELISIDQLITTT
jgi:phosphoglycolate phosphatase-like HAD superfamily hydrolase